MSNNTTNGGRRLEFEIFRYNPMDPASEPHMQRFEIEETQYMSLYIALNEIRETLDPNSAHAFACITPGSGVGSLGRTAAAGNSFGTFQAGVSAPHWVRLERDVLGTFTVSHSSNGSAWQPVELSVPTTIPMTGSVFVGLALTSHNVVETGEAMFSNVTTTGNVGVPSGARPMSVRRRQP